jgi:hypothetical protein
MGFNVSELQVQLEEQERSKQDVVDWFLIVKKKGVNKLASFQGIICSTFKHMLALMHLRLFQIFSQLYMLYCFKQNIFHIAVIVLFCHALVFFAFLHVLVLLLDVTRV